MSDSMPASTSPFCLDVEDSLSGSSWRLRTGPPHIAMGLSERLGLPPLLGEILAARQLTLEDAEHYLEPNLRAHLPDPSGLADMDKAAERFADAIMAEQNIAVFGDYDVDGATASTMVLEYLAALGQQGAYYIPDRMREGYGPNVAAMEVLAKRKTALLITVDCGTMAGDALAAAAKLGMDVIVTDHHQTAGDLPPAFAVVNPRRLDDMSGQGHLAGVGVAFLLLVATNRVLRQRNFFANRPEPNLLHALDLVALGTVCDVVPLIGVNRAFVAQGLKLMQQNQRPGLAALCAVARLERIEGASELGFVLGPRINAGGRVGQSSLGLKLLRSADAKTCEQLAWELDTLNQQRQAIQDAVLQNAHQQLNFNTPPPAILCADTGWHVGVIGIVAARLKDFYQRPSFVVSFDTDGMGKGSARSVTGIDLGQLISRALAAGHLASGGGHAMAAGFSLSAAQWPQFQDFVLQELAKLALDDIFARAKEFSVDGVLAVGACTRALYEQLARLGPYGAGNPEPRFVIPDAHIIWAQERGAGHIACRLSDTHGKTPISAIAFARVHEQVRAQLQRAGRQRHALHVLGRLRADNYRGRKAVRFQIEDASSV